MTAPDRARAGKVLASSETKLRMLFSSSDYMKQMGASSHAAVKRRNEQTGSFRLIYLRFPNLNQLR